MGRLRVEEGAEGQRGARGEGPGPRAFLCPRASCDRLDQQLPPKRYVLDSAELHSAQRIVLVCVVIGSEKGKKKKPQTTKRLQFNHSRSIFWHSDGITVKEERFILKVFNGLRGKKQTENLFPFFDLSSSPSLHFESFKSHGLDVQVTNGLGDL